MLDGLSKKVLNAINALTEEGNKRINIVDILDKMGDKSHKLYDDVYQCMWYLKENEYIVMLSHTGIHSNVTALHKAKKYKIFDRMEMWQFFRRSILVPIIVSAITAIVVLFINYALQWIPLIIEQKTTTEAATAAADKLLHLLLLIL